jgi:hypothetical protein
MSNNMKKVRIFQCRTKCARECVITTLYKIENPEYIDIPKDCVYHLLGIKPNWTEVLDFNQWQGETCEKR